MLTFDRRAPRGAPASATLTLPYEARRRSRQKVVLDGGEEAGVMLGWGETLAEGDVLSSPEGRLVRVVAAPEPVLVIRCSHPRELARVAYHLGNRHIAVEVGDGVLKIAPDHVLQAMVQGLGAEVAPATLPFDPEAGAYGAHGHPTDPSAAARIARSRQAG
jgi:urease accessory protein